jgi:hypothetical protein
MYVLLSAQAWAQNNAEQYLKGRKWAIHSYCEDDRPVRIDTAFRDTFYTCNGQWKGDAYMHYYELEDASYGDFPLMLRAYSPSPETGALSKNSCSDYLRFLKPLASSNAFLIEVASNIYGHYLATMEIIPPDMFLISGTSNFNGVKSQQIYREVFLIDEDVIRNK